MYDLPDDAPSAQEAIEKLQWLLAHATWPVTVNGDKEAEQVLGLWGMSEICLAVLANATETRLLDEVPEFVAR